MICTIARRLSASTGDGDGLRVRCGPTQRYGRKQSAAAPWGFQHRKQPKRAFSPLIADNVTDVL
ncbi:hypothetical protein, partial [Streptomyces microflavus]|uniref:hypothetical protein n=1 Tax=Streptomyces microflavus TaxID=1919 RepID=UPI0033C0E200